MGLQGTGRAGRVGGAAARTAGDQEPGGRPGPAGGGGGAARSPPHSESSPGRSPGAPAGRRKCSVTPARAEPAPGRRTWGAAGLCFGHHETRHGSPLEVKPPSSRASAGRSRGQLRDPHPRIQYSQLPRLSPGTGWAARRLGRGTSGRGRPPARVAASRGGGSYPSPPAALGWRRRLSEGGSSQDFPARTSCLRGEDVRECGSGGAHPHPQSLPGGGFL